MTDDSGATRNTLVLATAVLVVILVLVVADLLADASEGVEPGHLLLEGGAALAAAIGLVLLTSRVRVLLREGRELRRELASSHRDAERWREQAAEVVQDFRVAIDQQLADWALTPAEREIAMLLLQGLSHKRIAARRAASERTVRQQAHQLYRKAGLGGRADLSAFFLDDLLVLNPEQSAGERL